MLSIDWGCATSVDLVDFYIVRSGTSQPKDKESGSIKLYKTDMRKVKQITLFDKHH